VFADPGHEPVDDGQGDGEGDDKANRQDDPLVRVHRYGLDEFADFGFGMEDGFVKVVERSDEHRGEREEEREFQGAGAGHSGDLAGGDGGHRAACAGEDGCECLYEADPDGLEKTHVFHAVDLAGDLDFFGLIIERRDFMFGMRDFDERGIGMLGALGRFCAGFATAKDVIHGPHDRAASDERHAHDEEAFEVLADHLLKHECGDGCAAEGDEGEGDGVGEDGFVAQFAARESADELGDALAEVDREAEHRAELDDDGVHLPEAIIEIDTRSGFDNAEVGGGTDREEFGQAFDDAEDQGEEIVIHAGTQGLREVITANTKRDGTPTMTPSPVPGRGRG